MCQKKKEKVYVDMQNKGAFNIKTAQVCLYVAHVHVFVKRKTLFQVLFKIKH